ncbi:MAG: hypothetical protein DRO13_05585 [Thermoprotei archaeon]|nr:MAG: hypothetical protein DRO13_05585 [Thermoprotei archaeon]
MLGLRVEEVDNYIGRSVSDPYGRRVGYIIGFYSDSDGNVTSLEVSIGDLEFKEIGVDRFELNNGDIVLMPEWEYEAKLVENRLERLRKRIVALNELYDKKEIPRHTYEEFKKKLEEDLFKTRETAKRVKEVLKKRLYDLDDTILELEKAMTSLKVSYLAGEIPEKAYKTAIDQVRKHMEFTQREKESVKKHLDKIETLERQPIDLGTRARESEEASEQEQSLPVVVLET